MYLHITRGRFKAEINFDASVLAGRCMSRFKGFELLQQQQSAAEVCCSVVHCVAMWCRSEGCESLQH